MTDVERMLKRAEELKALTVDQLRVIPPYNKDINHPVKKDATKSDISELEMVKTILRVEFPLLDRDISKIK